MRILYGLTPDRAVTPGLETWIAWMGIRRRFRERRGLGEPRPPRAEDDFRRPCKIVELTRRMGGVLLLAALGASGQWCAAAVVGPPPTNRVVLAWDSLGTGTRYYVQTSTNLLTWTAGTNSIATNVVLTFSGDKSPSFRLWASNAPPVSAKATWDPSVPSTDVAGYFIYYGRSRRTYTNRVDVGLATTGVVSNLLAATPYYFAVTAYASSGLESDFSNEAVCQRPLRLRIQRLP
jgi:hypothetical protein